MALETTPEFQMVTRLGCLAPVEASVLGVGFRVYGLGFSLGFGFRVRGFGFAV